MSQKVLLNSKEINIILHRLACQLIENHPGFEDTVIIGIQPRGVYMANRIIKVLEEEYGIKKIANGNWISLSTEMILEGVINPWKPITLK